MKTATLRCLGIILLLAVFGLPAGAQEPTAEEIGKALANPVSNVWALFTEFDFSWNDGDLNDGDDRVGYSTLFQPVMPIPFTKNSKLITRPTLPIFWSQPVPEPNGRGGLGFDRKTALGDMTLPILWSPNKPIDMLGGQFVWGAGPTFGFPTATDDAFKSNQFQIGPAGVLVWKNDSVTLGMFPQYFFSYADVDSDAANVNKGVLLYFMFYNLPNAWQVGFNPTITYDNNASSGNKWNVPIGLTVAKTTKIGSMHVKFQLGAEYSVVNEDDFGKQWLIKLNIIPVIAPLIKNPLF